MNRPTGFSSQGGGPQQTDNTAEWSYGFIGDLEFESTPANVNSEWGASYFGPQEHQPVPEPGDRINIRTAARDLHTRTVHDVFEVKGFKGNKIRIRARIMEEQPLARRPQGRRATQPSPSITSPTPPPTPIQAALPDIEPPQVGHPLQFMDQSVDPRWQHRRLATGEIGAATSDAITDPSSWVGREIEIPIFGGAVENRTVESVVQHDGGETVVSLMPRAGASVSGPTPTFRGPTPSPESEEAPATQGTGATVWAYCQLPDGREGAVLASPCNDVFTLAGRTISVTNADGTLAERVIKEVRDIAMNPPSITAELEEAKAPAFPSQSESCLRVMAAPGRYGPGDLIEADGHSLVVVDVGMTLSHSGQPQQVAIYCLPREAEAVATHPLYDVRQASSSSLGFPGYPAVDPRLNGATQK